MTSLKYAVLMETSSVDFESWYYFVKYNGNEEELKNISTQFSKIETPTVYDDINIFDIDVVNLVNEQTASDIIMLELNSVSYHRKFDGVLKNVDFDFEEDDNDMHRLYKIFDVLGNGNIDEYISDEDIPDNHQLSDDDNSSTEDLDIDTDKLPECFNGLNMKKYR
uniref:Uncharacterized protein n=1 Tax=viral metagenome TaxID=1070528 RepID=A0A6C0LVY0_9ZZZZ